MRTEAAIPKTEPSRPSASPSALKKLRSGRLRAPTFEEIDERVKAGKYQFHDFGSCFVITQIIDYERERLLEVVLLFGSGFLDKREEVTKKLVDFGKAHSCQAIEAISRLGLESAMKPFGWKRARVLLRREIG